MSAKGTHLCRHNYWILCLHKVLRHAVSCILTYCSMGNKLYSSRLELRFQQNYSIFRRGITPPHRIKSISMSSFSADEVEFMRERGNAYCAKVWLGLYDGKTIGNDAESIKDFIMQKYEKKRYVLKNDFHATLLK